MREEIQIACYYSRTILLSLNDGYFDLIHLVLSGFVDFWGLVEVVMGILWNFGDLAYVFQWLWGLFYVLKVNLNEKEQPRSTALVVQQ